MTDAAGAKAPDGSPAPAKKPGDATGGIDSQGAVLDSKTFSQEDVNRLIKKETKRYESIVDEMKSQLDPLVKFKTETEAATKTESQKLQDQIAVTAKERDEAKAQAKIAMAKTTKMKVISLSGITLPEVYLNTVKESDNEDEVKDSLKEIAERYTKDLEAAGIKQGVKPIGSSANPPAATIPGPTAPTTIGEMRLTLAEKIAALRASQKT